MANLKKYKRSEVESLALHVERNEKKTKNKNIDSTRSHLNYSLLKTSKKMVKKMNNRLEKFSNANNKYLNVCCVWTIELPKQLLAQNNPNLPAATIEEQQRLFFEEAFNFLNTLYGKINVIAAYVHNDELVPHLHYCFIPIAKNKEKGRYISSSDLITLIHLSRFHSNLHKHLRNVLPFYTANPKFVSPATKENPTPKSLHEQIGEFVTKNIEGINCLEDFESWYNEVKREGNK